MSEQSTRDKITDAIMRQFLPNTYGPPARGAPNPFTPPLWRDQRNPDDPLYTPPTGIDPEDLISRGPYRGPR